MSPHPLNRLLISIFSFLFISYIHLIDLGQHITGHYAFKITASPDATTPDCHRRVLSGLTMMLQNTFLAIYLLLALLFSSLARGAAIPSTSKLNQLYQHEPELQSSHQNPSYPPPTIQSTTSNEHPRINALIKRTAYYFSETVPEASEIAKQLTALREAGFLPSSSRPQQQHRQDQLQTTSTRSSELPSPPVGLFIFASGIVCVATIVSKLRTR